MRSEDREPTDRTGTSRPPSPTQHHSEERPSRPRTPTLTITIDRPDANPGDTHPPPGPSTPGGPPPPPVTANLASEQAPDSHGASCLTQCCQSLSCFSRASRPPDPSDPSHTTNPGTSNPTGSSSWNCLRRRAPNPRGNTNPPTATEPPVTRLTRNSPYTRETIARVTYGTWLEEKVKELKRHRRLLIFAAVTLALGSLVTASVPASLDLKQTRHALAEAEASLTETTTALQYCQSNSSLTIHEDDITSAAGKVVQAADKSEPSIAKAFEQFCDFTEAYKAYGPGLNLTETQEKVLTALCIANSQLSRKRHELDSTNIDSVD